ncbi:MAG: sterol desaturase [Lysobacterales bacterium CG17_big_fil_post_rev_8_21_14_2_50_64_11]|nr:MAG: sterol desaturase [Xanthomonadales bacterium CG17_big_fil_post_rev_8_21_14_2_50_64_11]
MNSAWLLAHEGSIRLGAFVSVLIVVALIERRWPARSDAGGARRTLTNASLVVIGSLLLRVAFPVLAVGLASRVHAQAGGLFGALHWPATLEIVLAIVLLDLAIYWQHRLFHVIPVLWRMHRVHHCDVAFDVTTGVRFHPFEIAASMALKLALVALLGPDPVAVIAFELLLSLGSLITHGNYAFSTAIDRRIRWLLVTPSMHRIHHSVRREETDSNYGFHLSIWDRLFASYRAQPHSPEREMAIGLDAFREPSAQRLPALLAQPFKPQR